MMVPASGDGERAGAVEKVHRRDASEGDPRSSARLGTFGWWSHGRLLVGILALILSCTFASSALAWRPPTRSEHRALARAAREIPTAYPGKTVHVGGIRVSTVGPWASAQITIYIDGTPDGAIAILHKVRGRWVKVGAGSSEEECVMPQRDRQDLGFDERCPA